MELGLKIINAWSEHWKRQLQPNISFQGEYKCLRFLTPDVTIEWEEKRNLKVAQKRALESIREHTAPKP